MSRPVRLLCEARITTGPRAGALCRQAAFSIVTAAVDPGMLVCGVHRRAFTDAGLARIAYYDRDRREWP